MTLDLISRLAVTEGESQACAPSPEAWFAARYGTEPDYSDLLASTAVSPSERTSTLQRYFEGAHTDEEPAYRPSTAHQAIAKLVRRGYIRVILTTNFDRLMERALEAEGVAPAVLSTPDDIAGAMPLAHARCTLIKVHGDYRDTRLKNTATDLLEYDVLTNTLLDRVFDEYGLIVSGWSATWDVALRNAMHRSPNRRFTNFWTKIDSLSHEAEKLVRARAAQEISVASADEFFSQIDSKIEALEEFDRPHPISIEIAVRSAKKFVSEDRYRVQLHDLLVGEAARIVFALNGFSSNSQITAPLYLERITLIEATMSQVLPTLLITAFWCTSTAIAILHTTLDALIGLKQNFGGNTAWISLELYPACLAFYAIGLGLIASRNWQTFASFSKHRSNTLDYQRRSTLLLTEIAPQACLHEGVIGESRNIKTECAASEQVFSLFKPLLVTYLPAVSSPDDLVDRLEYLCSLIVSDEVMAGNRDSCGWIGRWGWRNRDFGHVPGLLREERSLLGDKWPLITAEVFSSLARFDEVWDYHTSTCLTRMRLW